MNAAFNDVLINNIIHMLIVSFYCQFDNENASISFFHAPNKDIIVIEGIIISHAFNSNITKEASTCGNVRLKSEEKISQANNETSS